MAQPPDPEFGPRGYLPSKAAGRARKIVLRERMGLGWPLAAVAAALLVAAAGTVFLVARGGPPGPPFVAVSAFAAVPAGSSVAVELAGEEVLLVRAGGALRAFAEAPPGAAFCAASGRIESPADGVWALDGRRISAAGGSLAPLRAVVFDGDVYVDPTAREPAGAPQDRGVTPAC